MYTAQNARDAAYFSNAPRTDVVVNNNTQASKQIYQSMQGLRLTQMPNIRNPEIKSLVHDLLSKVAPILAAAEEIALVGDNDDIPPDMMARIKALAEQF